MQRTKQLLSLALIACLSLSFAGDVIGKGGRPPARRSTSVRRQAPPPRRATPPPKAPPKKIESQTRPGTPAPKKKLVPVPVPPKKDDDDNKTTTGRPTNSAPTQSRPNLTAAQKQRQTQAQAAQKKETPAQKAAREKAMKSGTAFSNRADASKSVKDKLQKDPKFRKEFESKYPTRYDSQPTTRPEHIPDSYNGRTTVFVNNQYGYRDDSGAFTAFTAGMLVGTMSDSMYTGMGYHISPAVYHAPVHPIVHTPRPAVVHTQPASPWTGFMLFIGIAIAIIAVVGFLKLMKVI